LRPDGDAFHAIQAAESARVEQAKHNLGHARGDAYLASMAEIYAACHGVLRPGGLLVTVTKNTRRPRRGDANRHA